MQKSIEQYMQRAINLSMKGLGQTRSNPLVGCVIAYEDRVIGEGWHTKYGSNHAEVEAINSVSETDKKLLNKATLFVTLEPCCHYGKTPPCADLIIGSGIPKVVIANLDPYEKVSGMGVEKLKSAGIEVEVGVLKSKALFVNRRFMCNQTLKKPYVILKWAETRDGYIMGSTSDEKKISGLLAQILLHRWRSEESAFLIGKNTLELDKPLLNNRFWYGQNPTRVILGNAEKSWVDNPFFKLNIPTYLIGDNHKIGGLVNAELIEMDSKDINKVLDFLFKQGLSSVVVEGGKKVLNNFLASDCWDEIRVIKSKDKMFYNGLQAPQKPKGLWVSKDLKEDILYTLYKNDF